MASINCLDEFFPPELRQCLGSNSHRSAHHRSTQARSSSSSSSGRPSQQQHAILSVDLTKAPSHSYKNTQANRGIGAAELAALDRLEREDQLLRKQREESGEDPLFLSNQDDLEPEEEEEEYDEEDLEEETDYNASYFDPGDAYGGYGGSGGGDDDEDDLA